MPAWFCQADRGRSKVCPEGILDVSERDQAVLDVANQLTSNTFKLIKACCRSRVHISIENPHNSLLWHTKDYRILTLEFPSVREVVVDYCQFGEPWRKRTRLVTWEAEGHADSYLSNLRKKCPGVSARHRHCNLSGWRPRDTGVATPAKRPTKGTPAMRPTKGTAAYPRALCAAWAEAVSWAIPSV